jgi:hypothetical protein
MPFEALLPSAAATSVQALIMAALLPMPRFTRLFAIVVTLLCFSVFLFMEVSF